MAVGLGQDDQAARWLSQLRRETGLGRVVAAALEPGPAVPTADEVASLPPKVRDWVVLQCHRAGRDLPDVLEHPFAPDSLAAMELSDAIEELALAPLGSPDAQPVAEAMSEWPRRVRRADGWGPTPNLEHPHSHLVAPILRTVAALGLRGALDRVDPEQFGSVGHHDLGADSLVLRPRLEALYGMLVRLGCHGWALQAARYDPDAAPLLDLLFANGLHHDVPAFLIGDLQTRDVDEEVQPALPLRQLGRPRACLHGTRCDTWEQQQESRTSIQAAVRDPPIPESAARRQP